MEEIEEIFKIYNLANIGGTLVFFYTELHGEFFDILYVEESYTEDAALFVLGFRFWVLGFLEHRFKKLK